MIGAAVALFIAAEAFHVLADSAIEVSSAGGPAIATLAGMAIGIGALMGVAAACGPALTAGAVGIGVFGAALLAIGGGVDLACTGIAKVTDATGRLVETISANAPEINSIVTNIGDTVDGTVVPVASRTLPDVPSGALAALCFARGGYKAWNGAEWVSLSGAMPSAASTAWVATFDCSQSTPRVRYAVGGTVLKASGSEWIPLATSRSYVSGVGYAGTGSVSDFKAGYAGGGYVPPVFSTAEDGHVPLAFGKDASNNPTFEVTIRNAVKDAWYTVYAADAVNGPYAAVTSVKATADGLKTLSIPAPSSKPTRFVRIGVSDVQIQGNSEL